MIEVVSKPSMGDTVNAVRELMRRAAAGDKLAQTTLDFGKACAFPLTSAHLIEAARRQGLVLTEGQIERVREVYHASRPGLP